jgi:hypothetical protein
MTHPSWPSNTWQIYSSDYDTAAAYYAVKNACEPVHAQLNLPDFTLAVTNISRVPQSHLSLRTRIISLDDRVLSQRVDSVSVAANSVATLPALDLKPLLEREGLVLVKLILQDAKGRNAVGQLVLAGARCCEPAPADAASGAIGRCNGTRAQHRRQHTRRCGSD